MSPRCFTRASYRRIILLTPTLLLCSSCVNTFQQVVVRIGRTLSFILVMAEHRDGRFRYEVPSLSTAAGHPRKAVGPAFHLRPSAGSGAFRRSSFNLSHKNSLNGKTDGGGSRSGIGWPKRKRRRNRSRSSNSLLTEYTINSTIHGVKYLGGPARPWPERLWWIIMFVISISVCTALIMNTYNKWTSDPLIVTFSQISTPVWKIPFPAVTICPTNIVRQSQFNFTDILTKVQDRTDGHKLNLTATE